MPIFAYTFAFLYCKAAVLYIFNIIINYIILQYKIQACKSFRSRIYNIFFTVFGIYSVFYVTPGNAAVLGFRMFIFFSEIKNLFAKAKGVCRCRRLLLYAVYIRKISAVTVRNYLPASKRAFCHIPPPRIFVIRVPYFAAVFRRLKGRFKHNAFFKVFVKIFTVINAAF